ncbi:MAG: hypothetical protein NWF01_02310 [Candidatus Bathyarchaeota archaeon]|nr:hypothetical protein [Candidatus Bathyarchaeota archaeon]
MTVKENLKNRIRGWFPQNPVSMGACAFNIDENKFGKLQDYRSIRRRLYKKYIIPVFIVDAILLMLSYYLISLDLIASGIYGSAILGVVLSLLYFNLILDIYVRRKTSLNHFLYDTVPIVAVLTILCNFIFWGLTLTNLVSYTALYFAIGSTAFLAFFYSLAIDYHIRGKKAVTDLT